LFDFVLIYRVVLIVEHWVYN